MLNDYVQPLLIATGAVTASLVGMCFAPRPALRLLFGHVPQEAVSLWLARHWALLVTCVGALLLWAAFDPALRRPVLWIAAIEKLAFVAMVLGTPLRRNGLATMAAGGDLLMALCYLGLLAGW
jgi:hypothetical protein